MIDTIFLQNIISPYRNNFFNSLARFTDRFSVYYMDKSEPDRNWDVSKLPRNYPNWVDVNGWYLQVKGFGGHVNPKLVWKVLKNKECKNIILAVSWTDPNIMAIAFAKRLGLTKKKLFFWAEVNYLAEWTKKHDGRLKWWFKRKVFEAIDGAMIIPGKMSEITFEKWGIKTNNLIYLPNTIDESKLIFKSGGRDNDRPTFIMPIRIIEKVKGGLNFFDAIGSENIKKCRFIIAGDGEDRDLYKEYIETHKFHDNIILEGFCDSEKMMELYNRVDALVLPSFSDPSPLSLVEACLFQLPILCSNHCGNHFEAVEEGENGYSFSPLDKEDIKTTFERFLSRRSEWHSMGEISALLYKKRFDSDKVIKLFLEQYDKIKS